MSRMTLMVLLGALALGGCVTTEEHIAQIQQADNAACRAMPSIPFDACMQQRFQYRVLAEQQEAAERQRIGTALQNAGRAMQDKPMQTTQCMPNGIGGMTCNTM
jgi:hypothetical protein